MLDDVTYRLLREGDTEEFGCIDSCIYRRDGDAINNYCFDNGESDVQCKRKEFVMYRIYEA